MIGSFCVPRVCKSNDNVLKSSIADSRSVPSSTKRVLLVIPNTMRNLKNFSDFYLTRRASVIASTTGTLSSVSSTLIMYIILRSESKLTSTYHRIMFFMSFWDLLTSIAIALTTLPMPTDNIFDHVTASYGNTTTCSVQGFFAYVGSVLGIFSTCILCIYYVCVLRFKVRDEIFKYFIEPVSFTLAIALSFYPGIEFLKNGLINPQSYEPYCTIGPYPFYCQYIDLKTCIRGGNLTAKLNFLIIRYLFIVIMIGLCTVVVSMIMIVRKTRATERILAKAANAEKENIDNASALTKLSNRRRSNNSSTLSIGNASDEENRRSYSAVLQRAQKAHRHTKVVTTQALMYVAAFILTWLFPVLTFRLSDSSVIPVLKMIFNPLQGFFNALIFVSHKVHNVIQSSPHLSICEAFQIVLVRPRNVPEIVISKIELVDMECIYKRLRHADHHENDLSFVENVENESHEVSSITEDNPRVVRDGGNLQSLRFTSAASRCSNKHKSGPQSVQDASCSQSVNAQSFDERSELFSCDMSLQGSLSPNMSLQGSLDFPAPDTSFSPSVYDMQSVDGGSMGLSACPKEMGCDQNSSTTNSS